MAIKKDQKLDAWILFSSEQLAFYISSGLEFVLYVVNGLVFVTTMTNGMSLNSVFKGQAVLFSRCKSQTTFIYSDPIWFGRKLKVTNSLFFKPFGIFSLECNLSKSFSQNTVTFISQPF